MSNKQADNYMDKISIKIILRDFLEDHLHIFREF
jgi:hypothetical protein